jgi:hypothetical protein
MGASLTGDWKQVRAKLEKNPGARLRMAIRTATLRNSMLLVREIKKGIRDQAPGGKAFAPLAQVTIKRKGSSKALIDTGFLLAKITERILSDGSAFVGLLRGTTNKAGGDLVNIGAVMEYGATIEQNNGVVIVLPPRPFLHPTMEKYHFRIEANYRAAIASVF